MKRAFLLGLGLVLLLSVFFTAFAITNGEPDASEHPYVGLAVFDDADGNPMWRCSGALISPTVFLTAGHCTDGAVRATVWFEEDVQSGIPGNGYPSQGPTSVDGTPYTHPDYNPAAFYLYDAGLVVLDEPVDMPEYGTLPNEGVLNAFKSRRGRQDPTVTAVGYGLQQINPVFVQGQRIRLKAKLRIVDLIGTAGIPEDTSVMVSANHNTGGTCFGDSGGPQFLNDTTTIVAVTSFGLNGNCAGVGGGYRIDQPDDLAFIAGFLP